MIGRPLSYSNDFYITPRPIPFRGEDFRDKENLINSLLSHSNLPRVSESPIEKFIPPILGFKKGKQSAQTSLIKAKSLTPNISLYFLYTVDLAFLIREAIKALYAPGATRRSWGEMENSITTFNKTTNNWFSCLLMEFHFT
ncbi:fungal-specific transcription factor domain-containing protein [Penicillium longicatenatum]|nr:fungal-specific transcription factor domain-containing protein [Penicillium longicatenatum]